MYTSIQIFFNCFCLCFSLSLTYGFLVSFVVVQIELYEVAEWSGSTPQLFVRAHLADRAVVYHHYAVNLRQKAQRIRHEQASLEKVIIRQEIYSVFV